VNEGGQESFGRRSPTGSGLGEVLEAGGHDETLAATFGDGGGQVGEGGMLAISSSAQNNGGVGRFR
jgi:hypothetical protein